MELNDYMALPAFELLKDEALRTRAVEAAEDINRKSEKPITRHQLHSIAGIIRGAGLSGLKELAKKQKEKNFKNQVFWREIEALISESAASENSLFQFTKTILLERGLLENEDHAKEKKEQKQIRNRNKPIIADCMNEILEVYFEHFTCHYYQITGGPE
jgi:hypothetical protein